VPPAMPRLPVHRFACRNFMLHGAAFNCKAHPTRRGGGGGGGAPRRPGGPGGGRPPPGAARAGGPPARAARAAARRASSRCAAPAAPWRTRTAGTGSPRGRRRSATAAARCAAARTASDAPARTPQASRAVAHGSAGAAGAVRMMPPNMQAKDVFSASVACAINAVS